METSSNDKTKMSRTEVEAEIKQLISQAELAKLLGVTAKTLAVWNRKGFRGLTLPKIKIGRRVFYRPDDVVRFQRVITGGR